MISKLKRQFMITFMSFFSVLLTAMLLYVYLSSAYTMIQDSSRALGGALNRYAENLPELNRGIGIPIFNVGIDSEMNITDTEGEVFLKDGELMTIVRAVAGKGDSEDGFPEFHVRYRYSQEHSRLFVIDMTYRNQRLFSLAILLLILGLFSIITFFFLSRYFSNMAISPVKKAWQAQNQFVSNASHELKTPLAIIMANNDMLAASEDKNSEQNSLRIRLITEEAARMKVLVEEILFLARSDENTHKLKRSVCSLSDLVTGCILMFEPVAFEGGIDLTYSIEPGIEVSIIKEHIRRLVIILIDNAMKYTPSGESVHISLKCTDDNRSQLTVHNTGVFISDEDIEQIFNRFYKSSAKGSSYTDSFGLGLSIAAKICEDHNGGISARSSREHGVTFVAEF